MSWIDFCSCFEIGSKYWHGFGILAWSPFYIASSSISQGWNVQGVSNGCQKEIEIRWRLKYDGDWNTMEIEIRLRLKYDDVWMNVHRYDNFLRWVSGAMRCRHAYKRKLGFTQEKAPGLEKGSKLKTVHTLKGTPRITLEKRALLIFNVYVRSTEIMFAANVCRHTCVHS